MRKSFVNISLVFSKHVSFDILVWEETIIRCLDSLFTNQVMHREREREKERKRERERGRDRDREQCSTFWKLLFGNLHTQL